MGVGNVQPEGTKEFSLSFSQIHSATQLLFAFYRRPSSYMNMRRGAQERRKNKNRNIWGW